MGFKPAVSTKLVVDSRTYGSVDEMPPDVRAAYDRAVASGAAPGRSTSTIVFNGREYHTPDDMPADVRRRFETLMARLPRGGPSEAGPSAGAAEGNPIASAAMPRWLLAAILAASGSMALWFLLRARG